MCEHCLDLGVNLDAMPRDWALKQPQPKLADAVRLFGKFPYCCEDAAGVRNSRTTESVGGRGEQLGLFA